MAIIDVETPQGIVKVEIAGDTPTEQETNAIRSQFFSTPDNTEQTFEDLLAQSAKQTPQGQPTQSNFDTESGIQNFGLRSALSFAENNAEEEAIRYYFLLPRKNIIWHLFSVSFIPMYYCVTWEKLIRFSLSYSNHTGSRFKVQDRRGSNDDRS